MAPNTALPGTQPGQECSDELPEADSEFRVVVTKSFFKTSDNSFSDNSAVTEHGAARANVMAGAMSTGRLRDLKNW